jgi:cell division protein ZapB
MNEELGGLESKVEQVIALCDALRAENHQLRDRIGTLEGEKDALAARMSEARTRLEGIMDRLPSE